MSRSIRLKHPAVLEITGADGTVYQGADQDWYRREWQQKAGCGPTAAAVQLAYVSRTRELTGLCPLKTLEQAPFTDYMEAVWEHVTPGDHGLNRLSMYSDGVRSFAAERGVRLEPVTLAVPFGEERPTLEACVRFLRAGLERDCPVAFLNLHNGEETRLDMWHWVLVVALEENDGQMTCTIADGGKLLTIDLGLWHRTARDLGGFIYI